MVMRLGGFWAALKRAATANHTHEGTVHMVIDTLKQVPSTDLETQSRLVCTWYLCVLQYLAEGDVVKFMKTRHCWQLVSRKGCRMSFVQIFHQIYTALSKRGLDLSIYDRSLARW